MFTRLPNFRLPAAPRAKATCGHRVHRQFASREIRTVLRSGTWRLDGGEGQHGASLRLRQRLADRTLLGRREDAFL